mgnify:CR=1 FL=1
MPGRLIGKEGRALENEPTNSIGVTSLNTFIGVVNIVAGIGTTVSSPYPGQVAIDVTSGGGGGSGWALTGNTGTTAGTNFIGTLDAKNLVFKINNTFAGTLSFTQNSTAFGLNCLPSDTGGSNSAYGVNSMGLTVAGTGNAAFGNSSLGANISGNFNAAFGNGALSATIASNNSALGSIAGNLNTTGGRNVFIGLGANAASATASGQLSIQNIIYGTGNIATGTNISTGNIGIGTNAPSQKFHVAGNMRIDNAFMPNNLPGTSGEILFSQGANTAPIWGSLITAETTYTPTYNNFSNLTAVTAVAAYAYRIANYVTVWGRFDITPSASGVICEFDLTLPYIPSLSFTSSYLLTGTFAAINQNVSGGIYGKFTDTRATTRFLSTGTTILNCSFLFTYKLQ